MDHPMDHPEGAGSDRGDRVDFDRRVRLEFRSAQSSSDGGLLVMHELDDAIGLSGLASSARRAVPAIGLQASCWLRGGQRR